MIYFMPGINPAKVFSSKIFQRIISLNPLFFRCWPWTSICRGPEPGVHPPWDGALAPPARLQRGAAAAAAAAGAPAPRLPPAPAARQEFPVTRRPAVSRCVCRGLALLKKYQIFFVFTLFHKTRYNILFISNSIFKLFVVAIFYLKKFVQNQKPSKPRQRLLSKSPFSMPSCHHPILSSSTEIVRSWADMLSRSCQPSNPPAIQPSNHPNPAIPGLRQDDRQDAEPP